MFLQSNMFWYIDFCNEYYLAIECDSAQFFNAKSIQKN